jgi:hypothetical protein
MAGRLGPATHLCGPPWLTGDAELEVEITDVEGKVEPAEVMDDQSGEDDEQDRHYEPKQPPEEGRHTASYTHGAPTALKPPMYARQSRQSSQTSQSSQSSHPRLARFDDHAPGQVPAPSSTRGEWHILWWIALIALVLGCSGFG